MINSQQLQLQSTYYVNSCMYVHTYVPVPRTTHSTGTCGTSSTRTLVYPVPGYWYTGTLVHMYYVLHSYIMYTCTY